MVNLGTLHLHLALLHYSATLNAIFYYSKAHVSFNKRTRAKLIKGNEQPYTALKF